MMARNTDRN